MEKSSDSSSTGDTDKIFLLVATIFFMGRIWMDIFILTVNFRDWRKKKRLRTTDRILTLQGSIRICLGCTIMIWFTLAKLCPWIIQRRYVLRVLSFTFWYFISCNTWLTASLCSYYCVKIADFRQPFFIHLKRRLSGLESAWLLGASILALASSLPFAYSDFRTQNKRNFPDFFQNKNGTDISHTTLESHTQALLALGYLAGFGICATSAGLLLFSLWRHRQRMLGSWGGHRSPQTEAHLQAVITIFFLLVNSVIVFICIQLLLSRDLGGNWISHLAVVIILCSCFSVESLISIWGNKKLKNALRRPLCFATCKGCVN